VIETTPKKEIEKETKHTKKEESKKENKRFNRSFLFQFSGRWRDPPLTLEIKVNDRPHIKGLRPRRQEFTPDDEHGSQPPKPFPHRRELTTKGPSPSARQ
jgi:hypothetical protein